MAGVVDIGSRFAIDELPSQGAVDQDGELASGGALGLIPQLSGDEPLEVLARDHLGLPGSKGQLPKPIHILVGGLRSGRAEINPEPPT